MIQFSRLELTMEEEEKTGKSRAPSGKLPRGDEWPPHNITN
jgi:hypothetical protein